MSSSRFRLIASSLPGVIEGSHHGHADFRAGKRIFATLGYPDQEWGTLILTPDQQSVLVEAEPDIFRPVPGGWGKRGSTNVRLAKADSATLQSALTMAWSNVAPKSQPKADRKVKRCQASHRTRNLEIPRCAIAHLRSGANAPSTIRNCASGNDEGWIASSRSLSSGRTKAGPVGPRNDTKRDIIPATTETALDRPRSLRPQDDLPGSRAARDRKGAAGDRRACEEIHRDVAVLRAGDVGFRRQRRCLAAWWQSRFCQRRRAEPAVTAGPLRQQPDRQPSEHRRGLGLRAADLLRARYRRDAAGRRQREIVGRTETAGRDGGGRQAAPRGAERQRA